MSEEEQFQRLKQIDEELLHMQESSESNNFDIAPKDLIERYENGNVFNFMYYVYFMVS